MLRTSASGDWVMTKLVHMDFETSSTVSVRDVGAYAYAQHRDTRAECCAYAFDMGAVEMWVPGDPFPRGMETALLSDGDLFAAHNSMFEYAIWKHLMVQYGWPPVPPIERWVDSMASCAYRALPLGLDKAGQVMHLTEVKSDTGKPLLNRLHLPLGSPKRTLTPEERVQLHEYNTQDVRAEGELLDRLGPLPPSEQAIWGMSQRMNERGLQIDVEAARSAISLANQIARRLNSRVHELTGGRVERATQRDRILRWAGEVQNYRLPDLKAETVDLELGEIESSMPPGLREVLTIRRTLAKSSVSKYEKMLLCMSPDGRVRGTTQYHGAHTGREAGRLIQPQNFPRPSDEDLDFDQLVQIIKLGNPALLEAIYGEPLVALADALRPTITCASGHKLCGGDLSAIEGVVTAWIAGEEWKLQAFRDIFAGEGYKGSDDIYCATASQILGRTITKKEDPKARQEVGKPAELAFGFEGGLGAWAKFDSSGRFSDEEVHEFKDSWRAAHPMTKALWRGLRDACLNAVACPGREFTYRCITFQSDDQWLGVRLPSGRCLWYREPVILETPAPWLDRDGDQVYQPTVFYWTWKAGHWMRDNTYGGKLTENVVQAAARDLIMHSAMLAEAEGLPLVLTVHDELLTEPPRRRSDAAVVLRQCMETLPPWATGILLSAPAWEGERWRK